MRLQYLPAKFKANIREEIYMNFNKVLVPRFFLLITFFVLPYSTSWSCPLRSGERELSFTTVMLNFSRGLGPADRVLQKAAFGTTPTAVEFREAIAGIEMVQSCTQAVLTDRFAHMVPDVAKSLNEPKRGQYLALLLDIMGYFQGALTDFKGALNSISLNPTGDYRDVIAKKNLVWELANQAHGLTP
jgi:hypothetical protein